MVDFVRPRTSIRPVADTSHARIRDLSFDPKMVESERGVVYSERRTSVDNNNFGVLDEQFTAAAFLAHPYHWPVVGWASDIESWTIADLKAHFSMGYAPNNAVMVVCGNVKPAEFMALAEKHIGTIPPRDPPPPVRTKELEQLGERRIRVDKPGQLPILEMGWHVPETAHADYYPLRVLMVILQQGESSRLYRRLVDKDQLAIFVQGDLPFAFDPALFQLLTQPREGVPTEKLEKAIYEEIERVQNGLVEERELEKAKNTLLAQFYRQMKSINGQANTLGTYEVFFGDYRKLLEAPALYGRVTREEIRRVARSYLQARNRTVGTLIPTAEVKHEAK